MYSGHGKRRTWERTYTILVCVWVLINTVLDINWGTHFANPVDSNLNVSQLLEGNLEISQLCSGRPTTQLTQLVFIVTCLTSVNVHIFNLAEALSWAFTLWRRPRRSWKEEPPLGYIERHPSAGSIPWERGIRQYTLLCCVKGLWDIVLCGHSVTVQYNWLKHFHFK
jgi:hypothetical protein